MTVTIEKEVWESTLRQSMEMTAKAERLEKQLEIAVMALKEIEKSGTDPEIMTVVTPCVNNSLLAHKALKEIKELN